MKVVEMAKVARRALNQLKIAHESDCQVFELELGVTPGFDDPDAKSEFFTIKTDIMIVSNLCEVIIQFLEDFCLHVTIFLGIAVKEPEDPGSVLGVLNNLNRDNIVGMYSIHPQNDEIAISGYIYVGKSGKITARQVKDLLNYLVECIERDWSRIFPDLTEYCSDSESEPEEDGYNYDQSD
jgi:hypothetical protein